MANNWKFNVHVDNQGDYIVHILGSQEAWCIPPHIMSYANDGRLPHVLQAIKEFLAAGQNPDTA